MSAVEIKYKAEVVRQYGDLPSVRCLASELNRVFMNGRGSGLRITLPVDPMGDGT